MDKKKKYSTFVIDGSLYGIEVGKVHEVKRFSDMSQVPLAPPMVSGLVNLRGQIVTAIDLRRCLHGGERSADNQPIHLIVYTEDGLVSFLVDQVEDVIEIEEHTFELPPETLQGCYRALIRGTYKLPGRLLLVLDEQAVMNGILADVPGQSDGVC